MVRTERPDWQNVMLYVTAIYKYFETWEPRRTWGKASIRLGPRVSTGTVHVPWPPVELLLTMLSGFCEQGFVTRWIKLLAQKAWTLRTALCRPEGLIL